ncbi:MAG: indole-3-glycerol phosphate synthase TrpC [Bacteriovoracaceae bacterium]
MKQNSFLEQIELLTIDRIKQRKQILSLESLKKENFHHKILSFESCLQSSKLPLIIAEVKKSSPSLGAINQSINATELAIKYFKAGAMAVSVLTEPSYFGGDTETLIQIRKINQEIPLLQKDFVIDPYQIYEARYLGADCVLLIVALLGKVKTLEFLHIADSLGLSVLVEVHNEEELEIALSLPCKIIGINNRNLHTLEISLNTSRKLIKKMNREVFVISESGIENADEIKELQSLGFNAFLIGSSLMKTKEPDQKLRQICAEIKQ